jgi:pimeloyl-ACP methyl ester carboxylesterase
VFANFTSKEGPMEQLVSQNGAVTAVRTGAGSDLVILHSLLCDRAAFDAVLPRLSARRRVTLINLPGFHGSRRVDGNLESYLQTLQLAFEDFAIAPGATVMGNGFGGTLALAFARDEPTRVGKLVLVDSAAGFPEAGKQAFRAMAKLVGSEGMSAIATIAAKRVYHDRYLALHPHVIDERRAVLLGIDPQSFLAACEVLVACDLVPSLSRVKTPTLVVYGAEDQATPPELNDVIVRSLPQARKVAIANCGHCPPLEMPDAFLAALEDFLPI